MKSCNHECGAVQFDCGVLIDIVRIKNVLIILFSSLTGNRGKVRRRCVVLVHKNRSFS